MLAKIQTHILDRKTIFSHKQKILALLLIFHICAEKNLYFGIFLFLVGALNQKRGINVSGKGTKKER
jgi:hypothetical protein